MALDWCVRRGKSEEARAKLLVEGGENQAEMSDVRG